MENVATILDLPPIFHLLDLFSMEEVAQRMEDKDPGNSSFFSLTYAFLFPSLQTLGLHKTNDAAISVASSPEFHTRRVLSYGIIAVVRASWFWVSWSP